MDKTQVELELQVAREWARQGNLERTILHIDLAEFYLLEKDQRRPTKRAADLPTESRQPSWADDGFDDAVIGSLP